MTRNLYLTIILALLFPWTSFADDTYRISGHFVTNKTGDIYAGVYSLQDYSDRKDRFPTAPYFHVIKVKLTQGEQQKIPFKFEGIKAGIYVLIAFQDVNENGKIDRRIAGGLDEPRGMYKESLVYPSWADISFTLDRDLSDITIKITDIPAQ
jgi:uncharacterized protein (DUF2141 family)